MHLGMQEDGPCMEEYETDASSKKPKVHLSKKKPKIFLV
jgi:hypothetical protein